MTSNAARITPQMSIFEHESPDLRLVPGMCDDEDPFDDQPHTWQSAVAEGVRLTPELITDDVIDFRDYQQQAMAEILNGFFFDGLKSQRLTLPTGCGKTIIFNGLAKYFSKLNKRVLVLVHRKDLLRQADTKMQRVGVVPLIEQGQLRALNHFGDQWRIVIASVQSLHKDRVTLWPRDSFDLVISDECHHVRFDHGKMGNHWAKVLRYFNTAWRLGVTATPGAMVKKKYVMLPGWQHTVEPLDLIEAIKRGALCELKFKRIKTDIDLRSVGQVFGEDSDFKQNELDEVIYRNTNRLATAIKENIGERRTIVFTPLVASSEALCKALVDIGVSAQWISGETKNPEAIYDAHEAGEFQVLVNCTKLTEGYDAPYLECVVVARPTRSINLYRQMVGRGTRPSPDTGKKNCLVLDFAWVTGNLTLVGAPQLFGDSLPVETEEQAETLFGAMDDIISSDGEPRELGLFELLAEAEKSVEERAEAERIRQEIEAREQAEREARRLKHREERFRYEVENIDAFTTSLIGVSPSESWGSGELASEKQCQLIAKLSKGKIKTDGLSKRAASGIIGQLFSDREAGLSSFPQREVITTRLGDACLSAEQARAMTFTEASAYISEHKTW